ncbi:MAG: lipopolysaccharide heptosyltransferase I [Betaproteobacteria bacterium]|nr:lipopolysaccharide heptosyltransferase I [Betaproteobacteria bacterium]
MRIAIVKSSSMGDVVHALPVVTDLVDAHPGIEIDWVVEEAFADLPRLHPAVAEVVPVAVRRWRRTPFAPAVRAEVAAVRERLRARGYGLVLDLQGLVKSAWLSRLAGAPVAGFDRASAREPLACLAYRHRYRVPLRLHAIERLRQLAGQALGHPVSGLPHFGLRAPSASVPGLPAAPFAVFLHATSRPAKQWPQAHWQALGQALAARGLAVVLPWGSEPERAQAEVLAAAIGEGAWVAPRLSLAQCAALLAGARLAVGVDTGLTHLSAALDTPTAALFAATPAWRFGPFWTDRAVSLGEDGLWPTAAAVQSALVRIAGLEASR